MQSLSQDGDDGGGTVTYERTAVGSTATSHVSISVSCFSLKLSFFAFLLLHAVDCLGGCIETKGAAVLSFGRTRSSAVNLSAHHVMSAGVLVGTSVLKDDVISPRQSLQRLMIRRVSNVCFATCCLSKLQSWLWSLPLEQKLQALSKCARSDHVCKRIQLMIKGQKKTFFKFIIVSNFDSLSRMSRGGRTLKKPSTTSLHHLEQVRRSGLCHPRTQRLPRTPARMTQR